MKKALSLLMAIGMLFSISACGSTTAEPRSEDTAVSTATEEAAGTEGISKPESSAPSDNSTADGKILVAYFSRADENYGVGVIEKGNTEIIAEIIAEETGGELFHIERETAYPSEYDACTDEAKQEKDDNARPALAEDFSPDEYDVIYLGFPIWWGDMPMPVYTWLESHDFAGKTIIPFCTHAGSGLSGTEENIKNTCQDANVLEGFEISGATAQNEPETAQDAVISWLEGLNAE